MISNEFTRVGPALPHASQEACAANSMTVSIQCLQSLTRVADILYERLFAVHSFYQYGDECDVAYHYHIINVYDISQSLGLQQLCRHLVDIFRCTVQSHRCMRAQLSTSQRRLFAIRRSQHRWLRLRMQL